ncbi:MAG: sulfurtransferase [Actinomycetota bacterium]|nr:sulfurtransferase [Actinomycetota bacterium]
MALITAEELTRRLGDPDVRIVDCRWYLGNPEGGRAAYLAGHIPTAVHADLDSDLSGIEGGGRHPLPSPEVFDRTLGKFGINSGTTVVAYDDLGGAVAARLWWMLTDQGHATTYVVDGGLDAWTSAGGTTTVAVPELSVGNAGIALQPWRHVASIGDIDTKDAHEVLVDVRSPDRYRGESEPVDKRAGHIPGAINLPLADNLKNSRFRSAQAIESRFSDAGVSSDTDVVVHCGSGVTACHVILAAEIAGLPRPRLYVGSWSEWSSTERPISTGSHP